MNSNNKIALITGAAKRIGFETALTYARHDYDIVISYNKSLKESQNLAQKIKQQYNKNCYFYQCDLTNLESCESFIKLAIKNHPNIEILVNNASFFSKTSFICQDFMQKLQNNQNIHLISPLILSHYFAQNINKNNIKNAQIINIIDKNITRYKTKYFYYLLSKKNLANLTQMLAIELAPNIRTNAIAPGAILPPIDNSDHDLTNNPLKYKASVANFCQAIEYLLINKFVNGQILYIDGGANLNQQG